MGNKHSQSHPTTANRLYLKESVMKGLKTISAVGLTTICSPFVIISMPFIGAYEFGTANRKESITGHKFMDGMVGGLLGVFVSPIAPFYCFGLAINEIFEFKSSKSTKVKSNKLHIKRATDIFGLEYNRYNIAVTGCAGTGKSSLVNGLLGCRESHVNIPPAGTGEITKDPNKYKHPLVNNVCIWDMPATNTQSFRDKKYFNHYCMGAFDTILIIFDGQLMASDIHIAREAKKYDIPVFFIKTKADKSLERNISNIENGELDETQKWSLAVSKLSTEMKQSVYKSMKRFKLDTNRLYVVSSNALNALVSQLVDKEVNPKNKRPIGKIIHEKILIKNLLGNITEKAHRSKGPGVNDLISQPTVFI